MIFRKAVIGDIDAIEKIYSDTHTLEESGKVTIGWVREIYPTRETAVAALDRGDLFVGVDDEKIVGTAVINQVQVKEYYDGNWEFPADDSEVMVLHALVISPDEAGRGLGKAFVAFYEEYALLHGCHYLRMDTNEKNVRARALYKKLGFSERGNIPCTFNGIEGVQLILLEKKI